LRYFWNYIYLKPTGEFSPILGLDQVYQYEQTPTLHTGFELYGRLQLFPFLAISDQLDYVYLINLENNFFLPRTPPLRNTLTASLNWGKNSSSSLYVENKASFFGLDFSYQYNHNQIFTDFNEIPSLAYHLLNVQVYASFNVNKTRLTLSLIGENLSDRQYVSPLSNYKFLNLPEIGRNIKLQANLKF
jgi:iron complex outermembrane receptor protein